MVVTWAKVETRRGMGRVEVSLDLGRTSGNRRTGWSHEQSTPWVEKALTHVAAMPPKKKKPKKKAALKS